AEMLKYSLRRSLAPPPPGCPVKVEKETADRAYAQHAPPGGAPAKGPIFLVLTDNRCASDCEYMVGALAELTGTVVAGANSVGVAQFVQPGYFMLPHTRVPFRVALGRSDTYGDGRSFDGYGLDVDIVLASHEAYSAAGVTALAKSLSR